MGARPCARRREGFVGTWPGALELGPGRAPAAPGTGSFAHGPYENIMKIIYFVLISYYFYIYLI